VDDIDPYFPQFTSAIDAGARVEPRPAEVASCDAIGAYNIRTKGALQVPFLLIAEWIGKKRPD
jgi:hypothetical protein